VLFATAFGSVPAPARAEVGGEPVRQGSGPLSDLSTNGGAGSGPVHQRGRSVRDGSMGNLGGNPVRGSVTGDVRSGPVSELSVGPATESRPVTGGGTVTDSSAGAVKKDITSPLGEMISAPLHELGPLQEQLRAVQPLPRLTPLPSEVQSALDAEAQAAAQREAAAITEATQPEAPLEQPVEESAEPPQAIAPEVEAPAMEEPQAQAAEVVEDAAPPESADAPAPDADVQPQGEEPPSEGEAVQDGDDAPPAPDAEGAE
jgi:hypothetical protein